MADKPILFSGSMINALLDGRKTQTRRVLKPQPPQEFSFLGIYAPHLTDVFEDHSFKCRDDYCVRLPHVPGDRLWVREPWKTLGTLDDLSPSELPIKCNSTVNYLSTQSPNGPDGRYRHGRFMPRWVSRMTLVVTGVKVELVQDISEDDARAEGASPAKAGHHITMSGESIPIKTYRTGFVYLWNSIHGAESSRGYTSNTWVVAYTFEICRQNIDRLEAECPSA